MALRDDGKAVARGTGTFMEIDGMRYLATAAHVLPQLAVGGDVVAAELLVLPVATSNDLLIRELVRPRRVFLRLDVVAMSEVLDVAILRAPRELDSLPAVRWFNVAEQRAALATLRSTWKDAIDEKTYRPYFICGFPNFAHLVDDAERRQIAGGGPRQCDITGWDERTTFDVSLGLRPPQLSAEVFVDKATTAPAPAIERDFERQLAEKEYPFGGYSGGPLVLLDDDPAGSPLLLGTVKEGGRLFDTGVAYVTPIDVALSTFALI